MLEVSDLLAQSSAVRPLGYATRRRSASPLTAWIVAALVSAVYLGLAVAALKNPMPEGWTLVSGPTTWGGLTSMTVAIFVVVGVALTAYQWTMTRGARRRYRHRQRRLLDV